MSGFGRLAKLDFGNFFEVFSIHKSEGVLERPKNPNMQTKQRGGDFLGLRLAVRADPLGRDFRDGDEMSAFERGLETSYWRMDLASSTRHPFGGGGCAAHRPPHQRGEATA